MRVTTPPPGHGHVGRSSLSLSYQSVLSKTASLVGDDVRRLIYREAGRLGDKFLPWRARASVEMRRCLPLIPGWHVVVLDDQVCTADSSHQ